MPDIGRYLAAAKRLAPTVERIAELIVTSRLQHGDETGIRMYGMLHRLHVNCTRFLTHLSWHASRGREAMDEIGIWPRFAGRGMHDRLASYDAHDCAHSICGAHLVRDCAGVAQQEHQEWATQMQDFLLNLHGACRASVGAARRPAHSFYEQPGRAGPLLGKSSAKDFWYLSRVGTGVTAFCRIRRYLSTMQKQGHPMLSALMAVFHGHPLPIAWRPE